MKWVLISHTSNPGDIWVHRGIKRIIAHFDKEPQFDLRLTEPVCPGDSGPYVYENTSETFDYSVICGMPLVWNRNDGHGNIINTLTAGPWKSINGWLSEGQRMIVAGFGIYLPRPDGLDHLLLDDTTNLIDELLRFFDRCKLVYSRSPLANTLFRGKINNLVCPSVLSMHGLKSTPELALCNFMKGGWHSPGWTHNLSNLADSFAMKMSPELIKAGFRFVSHGTSDREFAIQLGWPKQMICSFSPGDSADELLDLYSRCSKFIGNRIHGGFMARSAGADTIVVGCDTRMSEVAFAGARVYLPTQVPDLSSWIKRDPIIAPMDLEAIFKQHTDLWASKLNLEQCVNRLDIQP